MSIESALRGAAKRVELAIDRATRATARATRWCGRVTARFLGLLRTIAVYLNLAIGYAVLGSLGHEITQRAPDNVIAFIGIIVLLIGAATCAIIVIGPFVSPANDRTTDTSGWFVHGLATALNIAVAIATIAKVSLHSPLLVWLQSFDRALVAAALYVVRMADVFRR
ncbi:MAG TPA: hypothetical protein VFV19_18865 [Candidatus Polarisedimenticolaceae bacterium]|nr:hypothetical protein [Candidatus Polarisedimenticolaceae bacterium]